MSDKLVKISKLKLWGDNPRAIKESDFKQLKERIKRWGQFKPVIITPDNEVIGGNMRLRAYMELGIEDIWVSVVNPKTEAEKIEIALADNENLGYYEDDKLAELVSKYKTEINLANYTIDVGVRKSLDDLLNEYQPDEVVEDEAPEVSTEPAISELGEVYQLGRHRLMCGDSTRIEDVEKLMNGQKADMVFTDPPYGVDYEQGKFTGKDVKNKFDAIKNDELKGKDLYKFIYDVFVNISVVSKEGSPYYVWSPPLEEGFEIYKAVKDSGVHIQSQLIWNKGRLILGRADYHWQHEVCWYGYRGKDHYWSGNRSLTTLWDISRDTNYEHPTQKPVSLAHRAVSNSSKSEDIVLDLFGGSGSTLIACEQLDRTCFMMEIDPKYCDVIRKRYAKFIGKEEEWEKLSPRV